MKLEARKILEEMKEIRFLNKGIEEIELYETLNLKIREYNDIECIPDLCEIMEDDVENCSGVEGVLETILILMKQNETESAIKKLIESTVRMKGHGDSWARILHTQLLKDEEIRDVYIEKGAGENEKEVIVEIFKSLKAKKRIKDINMDEVLESII